MKNDTEAHRRGCSIQVKIWDPPARLNEFTFRPSLHEFYDLTTDSVPSFNNESYSGAHILKLL